MSLSRALVEKFVTASGCSTTSYYAQWEPLSKVFIITGKGDPAHLMGVVQYLTARYEVRLEEKLPGKRPCRLSEERPSRSRLRLGPAPPHRNALLDRLGDVPWG